MPEFFQTAMGRTFFDYTMPTLVKELQRLNGNIEALTLLMKENKIDYSKLAKELRDSPWPPVETPTRGYTDGPVERGTTDEVRVDDAGVAGKAR